MRRSHTRDGGELEQFAEERVVVDSEVQQLRGDEHLGTSALGLVACQLQHSADQELQDGGQQDGRCFAQSRGMAGLPKMVFH